MSQTKKNLELAFAGESMARNKYTMFAKIAQKEGYIYIAKLLEEVADNERRHAKDLYTLWHGLGDTADCLKQAIEGENYETSEMYPQFAETATQEGEKDATILFKMLAKIEAQHRDKFKKLLEMVENGTVYKRENPIKWKCNVCGYIHIGKEPPTVCPACKHPKEHFIPEDLDSL